MEQLTNPQSLLRRVLAIACGAIPLVFLLGDEVALLVSSGGREGWPGLLAELRMVAAGLAVVAVVMVLAWLCERLSGRRRIMAYMALASAAWLAFSIAMVVQAGAYGAWATATGLILGPLAIGWGVALACMRRPAP